MAQPQLALHVDTSGIVALTARMKLWAADQLPFASAAALTDTAKDATTAVRDELGSTFELRNRGLRNLIRFAPADKRASPIESRVGVIEAGEFLVLHAIGGTKKAQGGARVAVPTRVVKRSASGRVPKRLKPRTLRESKKLVGPELENRGRIVLRGKRATLTYYTLVRSARIRARWPFRDQVHETARAVLGHHFARRARQALTPR